MVYIAFAYLSLVGLGLIDNSRGPLYPQILEYFQITKAEGALIFSSSSLAAFLTALPVRSWVKKLGIIRATKISLFFDVVSCWGFSFCGEGELGFVTLLAFSVLFGIGVGLKTISMNLIINSAYKGALKRKIFSGLHSMYGASSLLAPLLVGWLLTKGLLWTEVFRLISIPSLLVLIGFARLGHLESIMPKTGEKMDIPVSLLVSISVMLSTYVASEIIVSTRLVLYLKEVYLFESAKASFYLSLFFVGLLLGRVLFSIKELAISTLTILRISIVLNLILSITGLLYHPIAFSLLGLSMSIFFPCVMSLISERFTILSDYLVAKAMQAVGFSLVTIHYLFGLVSTYFSLEAAMSLVIVLSLICASILFLERRLVLPVPRD